MVGAFVLAFQCDEVREAGNHRLSCREPVFEAVTLQNGCPGCGNAGGLVRCRKTWRPSPLKAEVTALALPDSERDVGSCSDGCDGLCGAVSFGPAEVGMDGNAPFTRVAECIEHGHRGKECG